MRFTLPEYNLISAIVFSYLLKKPWVCLPYLWMLWS